ncbi:MAG: TonB-dependent receptor [Bryobacteraceae bacterium]
MRGREIGLVLLVALPLLAQGQVGAVRIEVKDPARAAVEASVRLTPLGSGVEQTFATDAQGVRVFDGLPYGRYQFHVSKSGFATQTFTLTVQSAEPLSRVVTLTIAPQAYRAEVVTATPLPGVELARDEIASPVQTANQRDIEESGAVVLSDLLQRRLNGVHINEIQGNPFQPDVNYRGYTASPLLGTPQGLSVYMDGVRLNQPFGDVVSWDLIPRVAISEVTLMPGSNPLFGLNTLGAALSVQTKSGGMNAGTSLEIGGGSFGRKTAELEHGGANAKGLSWYGAASLFFDDGWREASSSNVRQFFGKLGWQRGATSLGLTVAYANNALTGNGLQEPRFLARDYASIYTKPDITANRSPLLNFSVRRAIGNTVSVSGNVYYRYIGTRTLNGDLNEAALDQSVYQPNAAERAALTAAGYSGFPVSSATAANTPFPFWRCIAQVLLADEPGEKCNGLLNRTQSQQHNYGASGQLTWFGALGSHRNQFTVGAAYDRSNVGFAQSTQLGYLNPDRGITAVNAFADGVTGGNVDGEPFDTRADLHGRIQTSSVYATDTFSVGNALHVTVSGRFNRTSIVNRDRITPLGEPGSLDGSHSFARFNPAAGATYAISPLFQFYGSYGEGSRAPTSIELGCADPNLPCKLPNALAGDPPLQQVVTRTWEAGVRGGSESRMGWSAGWFRADNRDDLLFVASPQSGFGYFRNFGKTRRQGLEVDLSGKVRKLTIGGGYTFLDATYQSPESVNGSSNSSSDAAAAGLDGVIHIQQGAQIPLIPKHMLKAYADLQATSKLSIDLGMTAFSSSIARGNENNQHQADGVYYLSPGISPGYAVVNLGGRYQLHRRIQLVAQVNNLLDRQYYSAAQLGPTGFADNGTFIARPFASVGGEFPVRHTTFFAPGAPRGAWVGVRFKF